MILHNKIDQYLEIVQELEKTFSEAKSKEILPLSFFSSSIDIINRLKTGVYEIEAVQFRMMEEHLKKTEKEISEENEINETIDFSESITANEKISPEEIDEFIISETKAPNDFSIPAANIFTNTINRKIIADFGKSLSLNDRFMFQREFFQGDVIEMNDAFEQLDKFQSLSDALEFFTGKYSIPWESDSGIIFRELLEKRFA